MMRAGVVFFYASISNQTGMQVHFDTVSVRRLDVDQALGRNGFDGESLFAAEEIQIGNLVNARDGAKGSARFLGNVFALNVFHRVGFERFGGETALLRAIVDQAVFAYVQIARTSAATPIARFAIGDIFLEVVEARKILFSNFFISRKLRVRGQQAAAIGHRHRE